MTIAPLRAALWGTLLALSSSATAQTAGKPTRDVYADTWVATDALGRALPTYEQVGPPRKDRTVAIFYFLWLGQHSRTGPWDITRILAEHPEARKDSKNPAWGPDGHFHFWGKPLFDYYVSDDRWAIRRHAGLLTAAGVDALVFDTTNNFTYDVCWQALGDTLSESRRAGNATPTFAFLAPFGDANGVVRSLYGNLYAPGRYSDLWFRLDGKPLILANPNTVRDAGIGSAEHDMPARLEPGHTLGQSFVSSEPVASVGASLPTWESTGAAATLTLRRDGPGGEKIASRRATRIADNSWVMLELPAPQPAGRYYLELSDPGGTVGWWSNSTPTMRDAQAFADGKVADGTRTITIMRTKGDAAAIREAFTFRTPIPSYFTGPSGPDQWGWLEIYPQHVYRNSKGQAELVTVGVAQNAVDGQLSALSEERSLGRSYHGGTWDTRPNAVAYGLNFAEQWERALKVDPKCVFITGWNEWVAQRFDKDGRPVFVDQFSEEGSRDIEPMEGGHGDSYYYQMIANIRRYKGVRPIPQVVPRPITIDGRFGDWGKVQPEFRDFVGDTGHRNHSDWVGTGRLTNSTGRNDIVAAKVSCDKRSLAFYVRTQAPLTRATDPNWMLLYIDVDKNAKTGWMGYDFVVGRGGLRDGTTTVERNVGGRYEWRGTARVKARAIGSELELAIPLSVLGLRTLPSAVDFKWADDIEQTGEWSDFYLNGDAAPDARFNYRAKLRAK